MKINASTIHAINLMCLLANNHNPVSASIISNTLHLSKRYVFRIIYKLKLSNLLLVKNGPYGGYTLNTQPNKISLFDIVLAMEGNHSFPDYIDGSIKFYLLSEFYGDLDIFILGILKLFTLEDVAHATVDDFNNRLIAKVLSIKTCLLIKTHSEK